MTTTPAAAPTLRDLDLAALNSATKYPSIETYHALDPSNGNLLEDKPTLFDGEVVLTEKVDGTNGRIVQISGGGWVIGSREELLLAAGDLIGNPALGIADALRPLAEALAPPAAGIRVLFLEVYGGKTTPAAREYTSDRSVGHRLFDVAEIPFEVLDRPRKQISGWREAGGQRFADEAALGALAADGAIPCVPRLATVDGSDLPTGLEATRAWLADHLPASLATLDPAAGARPEGIVLRTPTRSTIAKARFQDYTRTLRRRRA